MTSLDPVVAVLLAAMQQSGQPPLYELPVGEARKRLAHATAELSLSPPPVRREDRTIEGRDGGITLRIYRPENSTDGPIALLIHGGGWALGSIATHDDMAARLCHDADATIVSVEYRLAPEHPYPAGLRDCLDALAWVDGHRRPGQPLAVVGDSAGANLAAALAIGATKGQAPQMDAQLLFYPCLDIDPEADFASRRIFGGGEYFLGLADMRWFAGMYLTDDGGYTDPLVSPILVADPANLPPALILTAGFDPLRDEGRAYHEKLARAGVESTYKCFTGTIHGFLSFPGALSSGRQGLALAAGYLTSIRSHEDG